MEGCVTICHYADNLDIVIGLVYFKHDQGMDIWWQRHYNELGTEGMGHKGNQRHPEHGPVKLGYRDTDTKEYCGLGDTLHAGEHSPNIWRWNDILGDTEAQGIPRQTSPRCRDIRRRWLGYTRGPECFKSYPDMWRQEIHGRQTGAQKIPSMPRL